MLESWYPLLFMERSVRGGSGGAGQKRAGGGFQVSFRPHGVDEIRGTMFGMRRWLPLQGLAGGRPGACNEFLIHRADGSIEALDMISAGAKVRDGEWFELRMGSGGGYGDPLDRDPADVARDVAHGRYDVAVAQEAYGVVVADANATERLREAMRRDRLARAEPPAKPRSRDVNVSKWRGPNRSFPGVVQRGAIACNCGGQRRATRDCARPLDRRLSGVDRTTLRRR